MREEETSRGSGPRGQESCLQEEPMMKEEEGHGRNASAKGRRRRGRRGEKERIAPILEAGDHVGGRCILQF
eukprot:171526-Rhodomonas_salina.1